MNFAELYFEMSSADQTPPHGQCGILEVHACIPSPPPQEKMRCNLTDRQTDRQRQTDRETDKQTDRQTETDRETDRQRDRQTRQLP